MKGSTKTSKKDNALPSSPLGLCYNCIPAQLLPLPNPNLMPVVDSKVLPDNLTAPKFLSQSLLPGNSTSDNKR